MRVLPYFNNIQQLQSARRPAPAREAVPAPGRKAPVAGPEVTAASGTDVFIPASPVSGVVYSTTPLSPSRQGDTPESVIKSGHYRLYQLNGSVVSREADVVGGKLDLKG